MGMKNSSEVNLSRHRGHRFSKTRFSHCTDSNSLRCSSSHQKKIASQGRFTYLSEKHCVRLSMEHPCAGCDRNRLAAAVGWGRAQQEPAAPDLVPESEHYRKKVSQDSVIVTAVQLVQKMMMDYASDSPFHGQRSDVLHGEYGDALLLSLDYTSAHVPQKPTMRRSLTTELMGGTIFANFVELAQDLQ
jgi:hypothetical protein